MISSEFKHLSKQQVKKRVKILNVIVHLSAAIAIASFVAKGDRLSRGKIIEKASSRSVC